MRVNNPPSHLNCFISKFEEWFCTEGKKADRMKTPIVKEIVRQLGTEKKRDIRTSKGSNCSIKKEYMWMINNVKRRRGQWKISNVDRKK